ncbi:HpcH/HpaI aldolase/citrate lyase family protein [Klebsiella aerogenes]|uniref:HpcH/HpaI aldolase/citrate lyase family protein n=1 Tax=Klebsiella aerogenes TaxID=548 RepID=UPI001C8B9F81|nr:HpcH/HpaI aldolase/citrate lyase family protein [Klebsiella aerogenes]MBX8998280.1 HpcH/HpaI aldolase/citrate lyase family protein [Klebsiella aerogenes]HEP1063249.1 HpcH/HpaI aldolase/citrate lyase family protein [Klebsiella aerogenes]
MKTRLSAWNLGATLYMPATRDDIASTIIADKIKGLRSLVICLEDSVSEGDVDLAQQNLRTLCTQLADAKAAQGNDRWPLVFIRPRHLTMAQQLIDTLNLSAIDGIVIPKFTHHSLTAWWQVIGGTSLCMMPTLETEEVFDSEKMRLLAAELSHHPCQARIIALRIGGNDLMNVISLRRSRNLTLYDGPMGYVIKMLVSVFAPYHFALTAPVCEHIDSQEIMEQELQLDMAHGLVGKTAIHPNQLLAIENALMVTPGEHADALRILNSSQAVFKSQGSMCEPATHRNWAAAILARAAHYGIVNESSHEDLALNSLS